MDGIIEPATMAFVVAMPAADIVAAFDGARRRFLVLAGWLNRVAATTKAAGKKGF